MQYIDTDILNFALNLEYLEAEFYACASSGNGIDASLRGGGPASIGCKEAKLSPSIKVRFLVACWRKHKSSVQSHYGTSYIQSMIAS